MLGMCEEIRSSITPLELSTLKLVDPARCILYPMALRYASVGYFYILAKSSVTRRETTLRFGITSEN